jgi:magnesium-transporting ATPase (P-type)
MYVLAAPMWDQRSQVTHKVTMAERYSRVCMSFMIKLAALCVVLRTVLISYTATPDAALAPPPLWALIISSVIAFNGFVPISIQATLKIMQQVKGMGGPLTTEKGLLTPWQVKGMGGLITDVIVSDKTGTMTRDNIIIDELVLPPCPSSVAPYDHTLAMLETLVMTLEIVQDAAGGGLKCSSQEDSSLLSYMQRAHNLKFSAVMPHLRIFTMSLDGETTTHRFAILDSIPYASERARVNLYPAPFPHCIFVTFCACTLCAAAQTIKPWVSRCCASRVPAAS